MREEEEILIRYHKWLTGCTKGAGFADLGIILKERDTGKQITKFMINEALKSKIPPMKHSKLNKLSHGPNKRRFKIFDISDTGVENSNKVPHFVPVSPLVKRFIPAVPDMLFVSSNINGWSNRIIYGDELKNDHTAEEWEILCRENPQLFDEETIVEEWVNNPISDFE
jgi:hypothetical protein